MVTQHIDALVVNASIVRLVKANPIGLQQAEKVQYLCMMLNKLSASLCNASAPGVAISTACDYSVCDTMIWDQGRLPCCMAGCKNISGWKSSACIACTAMTQCESLVT